MSARVAVLLAAGTAGWERSALEVLDRPGGPLVLLKRCLDLPDLLATAATGSGQVAVVADDLPGLDADSVDRLANDGVRVVVVATADNPATRARLERLGAALVLEPAAVPELPRGVVTVASSAARPTGGLSTGASAPEALPTPSSGGSLVAVWGPHGAPGRTTTAVAVAAHAAAAGVRTTLLDADPYGGTVGQHLAVLEEVSGLLAGARAANAGQLDAPRLVGIARQVAPRLRVLTGLPRPDRWPEVRPQAFRELLEVARTLDDLVVVDAGPDLPDLDGEHLADGPQRDAMTTVVLEQADLVLVVGAADPVGLTRLARALPDVPRAAPEAAVRVLVNRMRPTLGWSRDDVLGLLAGVAPGLPVALLPDDRRTADRALLAGRPASTGDGALGAALREVTSEALASLGIAEAVRGPAAPAARRAAAPRSRAALVRRGRGPRGKRAARRGQPVSSRYKPPTV